MMSGARNQIQRAGVICGRNDVAMTLHVRVAPTNIGGAAKTMAHRYPREAVMKLINPRPMEPKSTRARKCVPPSITPAIVPNMNVQTLTNGNQA